jgi:hypothetical protein
MRDDGFFNLKALVVAVVVLGLLLFIMNRLGACDFFGSRGCSQIIGGFKM